MVDMAHKLMLSSLLAFVPEEAQMQVALLISVLYLILILCRAPYVRAADDTLHMFCQAQIFVIILFGYVLQSVVPGGFDELTNIVLSIVMIGMVGLLMLYFVLKFVAALRYQVRKTQRSARDLLEHDPKLLDYDSPKKSTASISEPNTPKETNSTAGTYAAEPEKKASSGSKSVEMANVVTPQPAIARNTVVQDMLNHPRGPSESVIQPPGGHMGMTAIPQEGQAPPPPA